MVEISLVKGLGMSMNVIINPRWHSNRYLWGLQQRIMAGLEKEVLAAKAFLLRSSQGSHHNLYVSHVSIMKFAFYKGKAIPFLPLLVSCCVANSAGTTISVSVCQRFWTRDQMTF